MIADRKPVLIIFGALVGEYCWRTYKRLNQLNHTSLSMLASNRFRYFVGGVIIAYITILIRCIYRIPELLGGWGGELMRVEWEFVFFEGWMIVLCVVAQTVFHPGIFFPVMGAGANKTHAARKLASSSESAQSDIEMMNRS
jgi:hypothetical protein